MTLLQAIERAREDSKNGYVQHVNLVRIEHIPNPFWIPGLESDNVFTVSDWYDYTVTVASFQNGIELRGSDLSDIFVESERKKQ